MKKETLLASLSPAQVLAHPSAGDLFGEIPKNAPRVSRSIRIHPSVVRWHSTGLYAAPGEVVVLEFPDTWVGKGLKVQVSGHRDNISVKKSLMRLPTKPAMYLQLRDQFGWKTIQRVLAGYSKDQDDQLDVLPKSNQAKRDAFLVRMSQATEHNLTPFLQDLWGITMSPEAIDKVKTLPVWMPEGYGKYL